MDSPPETPSVSGPAGAARFSWLRLCLWLPICTAGAFLLARAAVVVQSYFDSAPLILFPLLVGVCIGAMLVASMRLGRIGHRPTIVLGTVLAVLVVVAGQHYVCYLKTYHRSRIQVGMPGQTPSDLAELAQRWIPSFGEFMHDEAARGRPLLGSYEARGWKAWMSWAVDGLLTLAAALAMVIPAMRQPFCNRCRSWYRVIRSGRIGVPIARRLAQLAEIDEVDAPTAARYRMSACNGGCGPTGFDLSWDQSPHGTSSARVWLDAEGRNRITRVLDEAVEESQQ